MQPKSNATTADWQVNGDYDGHKDRAIFAEAILLEEFTLLSISATFMSWRRQRFAAARPMPRCRADDEGGVARFENGLGEVSSPGGLGGQSNIRARQEIAGRRGGL